jgi:hypothetical protein
MDEYWRESSSGHRFLELPVGDQLKNVFAGCNPSSWGGGTGGIFQSDDSGASGEWLRRRAEARSLLSRATVRSTGPMATVPWFVDWVRVQVGLGPKPCRAALSSTCYPIEFPDGRIVSLSRQHVMISDHRVTWQAYGPQLPFTPVGVAYAESDKAFYIWQFDCGNAVLPNAIMKLWL